MTSSTTSLPRVPRDLLEVSSFGVRRRHRPRGQRSSATGQRQSLRAVKAPASTRVGFVDGRDPGFRPNTCMRRSAAALVVLSPIRGRRVRAIRATRAAMARRLREWSALLAVDRELKRAGAGGQHDLRDVAIYASRSLLCPCRTVTDDFVTSTR